MEQTARDTQTEEIQNYVYRASGEAITGTKIKELEYYEQDFVLSEGNLGLARAIIQNALIAPRLKKEIKGYRRWHTCQIELIETSTLVDVVDAQDRELEELIVEAMEINCLPETLDRHKDMKVKVKLIKTAITKRRTKLKKQYEKEMAELIAAGVPADQARNQLKSGYID